MRYLILILIGVISLIFLIFFIKYQSCLLEKNKILEINKQNEKVFNGTLENIKKVKLNSQKKIVKYYEKNYNNNDVDYSDDFLLQALSD